MKSHGDQHPGGPDNQRDASHSIVVHALECKDARLGCLRGLVLGKRTKAAAMSENLSSPKKKTDPRIQRTREVLGDALIGLIQEKSFDSITVQHVLDRAGVSRSTFYQHYRDKEDLFISDVEEFCQLMTTLL